LCKRDLRCEDEAGWGQLCGSAAPGCTSPKPGCLAPPRAVEHPPGALLKAALPGGKMSPVSSASVVGVRARQLARCSPGTPCAVAASPAPGARARQASRRRMVYGTICWCRYLLPSLQMSAAGGGNRWAAWISGAPLIHRERVDEGSRHQVPSGCG